MSLFQPSTKAASAVIAEIADTVGASADTEMLTRSLRSLNAAVEHFNNRSNWNFALTEQAPVTVSAPFSVTAMTASAGSSTVSAYTNHGLKPYDFIIGSGFAPGTRVSATAATSFTIIGNPTGFSGTATSVGTAVRDMYDLPSDFKAIYSVRTLGNNTALRQANRRFYDRNIINEQATSTPAGYDLFMIGGAGKIRVVPPPANTDTMQVRYYRRMYVPTATGDTTTLDIPQDYEPYLIAWAKWHFLVDKGDGRLEQGKTWFTLGEQGLTMMVKEQNRKPDESLMFIPGQFSYGNLTDSNTRVIPWEYNY